MTGSLSSDQLESVQADFRQSLASLGFEPIAPRRVSRGRSFSPLALPSGDNVARLVEQDGVLRWELGQPRFSTIRRGRRAGGRAALVPSRVVDQFEFERIEGSDIAKQLTGVDRYLTPQAWTRAGGRDVLRGLRRYANDAFHELPELEELNDKRIFLLIHGTFSNCQNFVDDLKSTSHGREFLAAIQRDYDQVLTFDHPTLSVSPVMNAFDLAAQLRAQPKQLDIVCHSRGGLVARWFCEAFCPQQVVRRVVFVGSPLGGTSLAAAPRLRNTCNLLSNLASVMGKFAGWFPGAVARFVGIVLKLLDWTMQAAARTPLFDAAVALVPGLVGQSRIGNNEELRRLRANSGTARFDDPQRLIYHAITADFEPDPIGWRFWRYFTDKPGWRALNAGADVVFGNANDLVVDTGSMRELSDGQRIRTGHSFDSSSQVHHINYFQFAKTVEVIRKRLEIA